jgi:threonine dehydratase
MNSSPAGIMFTLAELQDALSVVHAVMPPTPQYAWPLLKVRSGLDVVVKHENHTPIGAFKVRGGITYFDRLKRERPQVRGVVTATRGNHGLSFAYAGLRAGIPVVIVVPRGNSIEKNSAIQAFGAELIEHGRDFNEAKDHAQKIAGERHYEFGDSFHRDLVVGVATYAYELFKACPDLDVVYAGIGMGSSICGLISARNALDLKTEIVGVVSSRANAYRLSFEQGSPVETDSALTFADGLAVRIPDPTALELIRSGAARIVEVSEDEIAESIRNIFSDTHTLAEGAGAAPFAALMKERERLRGKKAAMVLTGQNIDRAWMQTVLSGATPQVS